jgi:hypothetical protein
MTATFCVVKTNHLRTGAHHFPGTRARQHVAAACLSVIRPRHASCERNLRTQNPDRLQTETPAWRPVPNTPLRSFTLIEKIGSDLSGQMQNGPNQNEIRLHGVKHRMGLKMEATNAWHDLVRQSSDTREVGGQVERTFQARVVASA